MPLEVSELFSMGPLARGCHSTDYTIPNGFNMGPANVRRLQDQLVSRFDSLATATNSYCNAEGKAVYFGVDAVKATMDKCKNSIRTTRDAAVKLMTAIYNEGHKPLPPEKSLDRDVARILQESLMSVAAVPTRTTVRSNEDAESSAAAEDRCLGNPAVCSNPTAGTLPTAGTNSFLRSVPRVKAKTKSSHDSSSNQTIKSCQSKPALSMGRKAPVNIKSKKIKFTISRQVKGAASIRSKSPRIVSRGAAARARAEVAWDTRARSESLEERKDS